MIREEMFHPALAMVVLTIAVWFRMYFMRICGLVDAVTLVLAWLFVALRVLHSAIHCTYNKVIHRFYAYLAGGLVLWVLWLWLAFGLLL